MGGDYVGQTHIIMGGQFHGPHYKVSAAWHRPLVILMPGVGYTKVALVLKLRLKLRSRVLQGDRWSCEHCSLWPDAPASECFLQGSGCDSWSSGLQPNLTYSMPNPTWFVAVPHAFSPAKKYVVSNVFTIMYVHERRRYRSLSVHTYTKPAVSERLCANELKSQFVCRLDLTHDVKRWTQWS